jgi:hypothetical protein
MDLLWDPGGGPGAKNLKSRALRYQRTFTFTLVHSPFSSDKLVLLPTTATNSVRPSHEGIRPGLLGRMRLFVHKKVACQVRLGPWARICLARIGLVSSETRACAAFLGVPSRAVIGGRQSEMNITLSG